ncbi:hypothetical protein [Mycobacterium lepromatosis]|uniref:hypothetical protein n=1 Tax=Mycobacterium lepromatosis TaxID=480418 RepID=UPI0006977098|nr:hypothetical protein [Mycobacterium lepromatosis]
MFSTSKIAEGPLTVAGSLSSDDKAVYIQVYLTGQQGEIVDNGVCPTNRERHASAVGHLRPT